MLSNLLLAYLDRVFGAWLLSREGIMDISTEVLIEVFDEMSGEVWRVNWIFEG